MLRDLGLSLGYAVWIASNDRGRIYANGRLGDGCLETLALSLTDARAAEAVRLIDVLWIDPTAGRVAAAFEVEHTTSIYSGILRMLDLALGLPEQPPNALFLVAPEAREADIRAQLRRPAFSRISDLDVWFLPYGELARHHETIGRFGQGMKGILAIAQRLP